MGDEMLIEFTSRTVDGDRVYYPGTVYRVPREVGIDYVSGRGWAIDCAGVVATATPAESSEVVLGVANSRIGQRIYNK